MTYFLRAKCAIEQLSVACGPFLRRGTGVVEARKEKGKCYGKIMEGQPQKDGGNVFKWLSSFHRLLWALVFFSWLLKATLFCRRKNVFFFFKLKVNPPLLWAGLTNAEASDQKSGGSVHLENIVMKSTPPPSLPLTWPAGFPGGLCIAGAAPMTDQQGGFCICCSGMFRDWRPPTNCCYFYMPSCFLYAAGIISNNCDPTKEPATASVTHNSAQGLQT